MMLLLLLLIVLQLTSVPAWTFPHTSLHNLQDTRENTLIIDDSMPLYNKTYLQFRIGYEIIKVIANNPCSALQMFYGFVASSLDMNDRDETFKALSPTESLEFINHNITSFFENLPQNDFINLYFGSNGKALLTKIIISNPDLLVNRGTFIAEILRALNLKWNSASQQCEMDAKLKIKKDPSYFDYLILHSLRTHLTPKTGYLDTLYKGCFSFQGLWNKYGYLNCFLENIVTQTIQLRSAGGKYENLIRVQEEQNRIEAAASQAEAKKKKKKANKQLKD
ncbi:hypothetical protein HMI54_003717 [Coelomomyces lativittatus]|nr:hypothetical protein HMI54_003717 [Coelomomyces lativittatus]